MLEYIKIFIISLFSSLFAPLAASSSAHFSFLNSVLDFSEDGKQLGFYFSIISLIFFCTSIFFVRKIYLKGFMSLGKKSSQKLKNVNGYRTMMQSLLISLIPAVLMFIPVSKEKFLCDVLFDYFSASNILISAFCSIAGGFMLIIALWYSRNKKGRTKKSSKKTDVLRLGIYQIPAYIFPGFSHVTSAATSLTLDMVDERVIMRETFLYVAPSGFVVSLLRVIRFILADVILDPIMIAVCLIGALVGSIVMLNIVSHLNIRKSFLFFSIYSIIFGLAVGVIAFV